jgi:hypothetical protein
MTEIDQRHVDIAFVAVRTPRREQFIARAAGILWEWQTDVRFFAADTDQTPPADTRILLRIHAGDEHDFDWSGVREAIADGCVVASETSVGFEPLVPGVHFLMAPYEHLAEQAIALAFDEPRRAALARAALELNASGALAGASPAEQQGRRRDGPREKLRRRRPRSPKARNEALHLMVTELKAAILAQLEMSRSLEATISLLEHGDPHHAEVLTTSTWQSFEPEVSVVVPMYDKGHHLADTVRSVMSAGGESAPRTELVIVDDHSTDGSRAVAARLLDEIDWFPAALVARAANGGPAVARNVGFDAARAPHVLVLEAGSTLYPTGLRRLLDDLQSAPSDVVATYGIVERFDTTGSLGPAGHMTWVLDVLVRGEFAAPAAMFRRAAWAELGGCRLPSDGVEDGREEYDLWLSAAERGLRAEPVGSVIGRHREDLAAIVKISDIDTASSFVLLRELHPRLPWPS